MTISILFKDGQTLCIQKVTAIEHHNLLKIRKDPMLVVHISGNVQPMRFFTRDIQSFIICKS